MSNLIEQLWDVVKERNVSASFLSWNGFNLMGDDKSIAEVRRLMYCEHRLDCLLARQVSVPPDITKNDGTDPTHLGFQVHQSSGSDQA